MIFTSLCEVGNDLFQRATYTLLVYFGNLTTDTYWTFGTKDLGKLLERFHQTVGRLVENHRALFLTQRLQTCLTSFLLWQESLEAESVTG